MAATFGRLTGRVGVCLSTLGPGATNLVTAAAYAQLGGMPMMMISGQKPIKSSKQGLFQILDVVDLMRPSPYTARSPTPIPFRPVGKRPVGIRGTPRRRAPNCRRTSPPKCRADTHIFAPSDARRPRQPKSLSPCDMLREASTR